MTSGAMTSGAVTGAAAYIERTFTSEDGLSLYFRDYGQSPTSRTAGDHRPALLCLGGLARNSKDFHRFASWRASLGDRVLCPDYRGRGRSQRDPDWRRYDPRVYLNDIRHLLAIAGVHRVVVVGTSLGGILAMGLAVLSPTAVAGAVLNDIGPEVEMGAMANVLDYLKRATPQPDWPSAANTLRALVPDLSLETDEEWLEAARATYREDGSGRVVADWDPMIIRAVEEDARPTYDLWPLFHALGQVPVLTIRGGKSRILTAETLKAMRAARPDMACVVLEGVGHAPTLNEPAAHEALASFLETF